MNKKEKKRASINAKNVLLTFKSVENFEQKMLEHIKNTSFVNIDSSFTIY